jgi:16S rRNA (guanine527-N7)-methyltransferase
MGFLGLRATTTANNNDMASAVRQHLPAWARDIGDVATAHLSHFLRLLSAENQRQNLTGTRDEAELWRIHIGDSLKLLPLLHERGVNRLLDLGSGGGLPGIPLACVRPDLHVTLLDATRKKVAAVERMVAALELSNVRAVWGRAEALAHQPEYREQFDAVAVRAVAALPVLLEYAAGFVRPGGTCWFYKSAAAAEPERVAAESAARRCRLSHVATHAYRLPDEVADRALLEYRKDGELDADLPREVGLAKEHPL